jgi:hypothetical protein
MINRDDDRIYALPMDVTSGADGQVEVELRTEVVVGFAWLTRWKHRQG